MMMVRLITKIDGVMLSYFELHFDIMNCLETLQLGDTKTSVMMTDGVLVFKLVADILGIKYV